MQAEDFLFELGCEELPPTSLKTLMHALYDGVCQGLQAAGLEWQKEHSRAYASPRRLGFFLAQLSLLQADREVIIEGPPVRAAFAADGQPTAAALGFARKQGVSIDALDRSQDKLRLHRRIAGQSARELLPAIIAKALADLPIAKRMRWGARKEEFVRPVHTLVLLLGDSVVAARILGLESGRQVLGHRFMAPGPHTLAHARDYLPVLRAAYVMPDFTERRHHMVEQVQSLQTRLGGRALMPADLLDEVCALVEWPVALCGRFEERFLAVPQEALISTMQGNQKYFPLLDDAGKLLPHFIFISNIDSPIADQIIAGNERVVRPRLSDAEFFFLQDQKKSLADHDRSNAQVVFQKDLGSLTDKAQRVAGLAAWIAAHSGGDAELAAAAGRLCKADLATLMVAEFPELQGLMGRHYAQIEGLPAEVAQALFEQYLPRHAGDALPATRTGLALALADRLDSLVGIFGLGQAPTGSADPYALRRAALGVLRILIEQSLDLDLAELIACARQGYTLPLAASTAADLLDFFMARYRAYYEEQGIASDTLQAVLACRPHRPYDVELRIKALHAFRSSSDLAALAAANKRVANILAAQAGSAPATCPDASLLRDRAESALAEALAAQQPRLQKAGEQGDYMSLLALLAGLRQPIDDFFAEVMVMVDDPALRANRLALLGDLRRQFLQVGDFGLLQVQA